MVWASGTWIMMGRWGFEIGLGGTLHNRLADKSSGSKVETGTGKAVKTLSGFGGLEFRERL